MENELDTEDLDDTGKVVLDDIYAQPDPRPYYSTLRQLGYCIPQEAKPHFDKLIERGDASRSGEALTVLDLGCSYGINAGLLRCDATMAELYERYTEPDARSATRDELLARDRDWVATRGKGVTTRFVGLDSSRPALDYARSADLLDDAVHADLEERDPTTAERSQLAATDLVISTGCVGYISGATLSRLIDAFGERRPTMAHFVLRMFPFDPFEAIFADRGYETEHVPGMFKQRRFASPDEQSHVLESLASAGVESDGLEADGWLYAQLHISRARSEN